MFAMSQAGLKSPSAFGTCKPTTRLTRDVPRRSSVVVCSQSREEPLYALAKRAAAGAAAAVFLLGQAAPVYAAPAVEAKPLGARYSDSQREESLFEKLIRERGGELPRVKLSEKPAAARDGGVAKKPEGQNSARSQTPDTPLKFTEPVRQSVIEDNPRVPAPEPARPGAVSDEDLIKEGTVRIIGGDTPTPPKSGERKGSAKEAPKQEAPKGLFNFGGSKTEQAPKLEAPKASAPSLPKPPSLPNLEDLPKPAAPNDSPLPQPQQAAKKAVSAVKEALPEGPKEAAKDAASAVKSAIPEQPRQAAQDAASSAKDALPEAPKDIPNPLQNFFGGGAPKVEDAQKTAGDAASAVKSALPDQPQQAAKDAASAAKDTLPETPKDVPNPFQGFFGGGAPKVEDAQKAAGDAASAAKSALPDQPQQAAKDAASAAKDALPEPPKDVPNPFQGFFGGGAPKAEDAQKTADETASAAKSALPDQPQQAAKDAVSAAKDALPEPPKDVPNPFQGFFGGGPPKAEDAQKTAGETASAAKDALPSPPKDVSNPFQGLFGGDSKPQEAVQDAASAVKSALPGEPKQAAQEAASAAKDAVPDAPKEIANPFKSFFSGGSKEEMPEAADIPEQPKEAAQKAASAAKEALPEAPKELPNPFQGFFSGGSKPDEADTGKPQLPQQEPAVGPGQKIEIPESKSEAPEPKTEAPNPLGGLFGGSKEAPAPKREEAPAPVAAVKEKLPSLDAAKPDDNPLAGLFSSPPSEPAKKPEAPAPGKAEGASQEGASPLAPVLGTVSGIILVAIAAFSSNAKSAEAYEAEKEKSKVEAGTKKE